MTGTHLTSQQAIECTVCGIEKAPSQFYLRNKTTGQLRRDCKKCVKERSLEQGYDAAWHREHHLLKTYGITLEQFDEMLAAQDHACGICGSLEPRGKGRFHVDHCHTTGVVRGLLCQPCNNAIGLLQDDPKVMASAMAWVTKGY